MKGSKNKSNLDIFFFFFDINRISFIYKNKTFCRKKYKNTKGRQVYRIHIYLCSKVRGDNVTVISSRQSIWNPKKLYMASNADVSRTCVSSYDKALCTTTTTTQPTAFD